MNNINKTANGMVFNSAALIVGVVTSTPTTPKGVTTYEPLRGKSQGFLAVSFKYPNC